MSDTKNLIVFDNLNNVRVHTDKRLIFEFGIERKNVKMSFNSDIKSWNLDIYIGHVTLLLGFILVSEQPYKIRTVDC